jgi:hypothetical protein
MGRNTARYTGPLRTIPPRCTRGTISKNGERGIVPPFGEREVRGWPGAVCLLFSVLFLDLAESLMPCGRLGVMGHYDGGMLDIYSDLTQQCSYFGGPIEMMEVDEPSRPPAGCGRPANTRVSEEFRYSIRLLAAGIRARRQHFARRIIAR